MTGAAPDELVELRSHVLPPGTDYLWEWFTRLSSTRTPGFGFAAITETELQAFFNNRHITPTLWEFDLLVRMDRALRDASADEKQQEQEPDVDEG